VVRLTDDAAARIRDIMEKSDGRYVGVRVGVKNGGCAGMSYTMDYAEAKNPFDEVIEDKGVRILIDPKAVMFLIGTEMDFVEGASLAPDAAACFWVGRSREAQGNTSGAIEAYRKALELQPELYDAKDRLDALRSGRVFPFAKSENQTAPLKM